jgi:hypothetical protein
MKVVHAEHQPRLCQSEPEEEDEEEEVDDDEESEEDDFESFFSFWAASRLSAPSLADFSVSRLRLAVP